MESEWHAYWKSLVAPDAREVTLNNHRADVFHNGWVVEFQHSFLSSAKIAERETAYARMLWIFDGTYLSDDQLNLRYKTETVVTFRWKFPKLSLLACKRPVLIDLGPATGLLHLKKLYPDAPHGGWGKLKSHTNFVRWLTQS
jgi:hypothetical protein